jgi:hypothetical protein
VSLWGNWLLRNPDLDYLNDVAIILPLISKLVVDFIALMKNPSNYNAKIDRHLVASLDKVDKYLYGHPQLSTKCLIIFVVNVDQNHWYGICDVNPWKEIVEQLANSNLKHLHTDFKKKGENP